MSPRTLEPQGRTVTVSQRAALTRLGWLSAAGLRAAAQDDGHEASALAVEARLLLAEQLA